MKIRQGFVSNSSSTSFLIVGTANPNIATKLAKADGCTEMGWGGYSEGKTIIFLGGEGGYDGYTYEPDYAGISVESDLKSGKTIPELRKVFKELAAAHGFDIPLANIDLHYGECSDGN